MTYDQAVSATKTGALVTRPDFLWQHLGWDATKQRLYTIDHNNHKAIFHPVRSDRESTEWRIVQ